MKLSNPFLIPNFITIVRSGIDANTKEVILKSVKENLRSINKEWKKIRQGTAVT